MKNLQWQDVSIAFGARQCLDRVSLHLPYGRRIALSGANGSGKSTLMKIAAGLMPPDSGTVVKGRDVRVAYLPQGNVAGGPGTLASEAARAFAVQEEWLGEAGRLGEEISKLPPGSPRLAALLHDHHDLQERLLRSGYFSREKKIAQVLTGLGFKEEEFDKPAASFSLGWQMRLALARTLLEDPDFLLLDEPTNYLDLEARAWLLSFFNDFPGGILVVSHDRFFLDSTVSAVAELFMGSLRIYRGTYTEYTVARAREMEALIEKARQVEEERERIETFIRRFRAQASRASLVQSRIKQLEKLPAVEIPAAVKRIRFAFPEPPASGRLVLSVQGLAKSYGGRPVFRDVSFEAGRGEKIVVVGPNGAGKSTLLRLIAGMEAADSGGVRFDDRTEPGFFSIDAAPPDVDGEATVLETLERIAPAGLFPRLRALLGAFLFGGDDAFKPVRVLSGGERCRLLLLTLLLKPKNLLILDEPTSHLDINSQDVLLDSLKRFPGTVLFVSHDRQFIEGLAEKVIELKDGRAVLHNGDYRYYLWKKEQAAVAPGAGEQRPTGEGRGAEPPSRGREAHEQSKKIRNALKKLERDEAALLEGLDRLKDERRGLEASLADEAVYRDGEKVRRVKARLDENMSEEAGMFERWQSLEEERKKLAAGAPEG